MVFLVGNSPLSPTNVETSQQQARDINAFVTKLTANHAPSVEQNAVRAGIVDNLITSSSVEKQQIAKKIYELQGELFSQRSNSYEYEYRGGVITGEKLKSHLNETDTDNYIQSLNNYLQLELDINTELSNRGLECKLITDALNIHHSNAVSRDLDALGKLRDSDYQGPEIRVPVLRAPSSTETG